MCLEQGGKRRAEQLSRTIIKKLDSKKIILLVTGIVGAVMIIAS